MSIFCICYALVNKVVCVIAVMVGLLVAPRVQQRSQWVAA